MHVTNTFLESVGERPLLGPVTVDVEIVNTMHYQSTIGELTVSGESTARVILEPTALDEENMPDAGGFIYLPQVGN